MKLRNRLCWRRKTDRVRDAAWGRLIPPAGLCDPCRELLAKQPAVVLKAPKNTKEDGAVRE